MMNGAVPSILDVVGPTPIVRLNRVAEGLAGVELYLKCEHLDASGSSKDRLVRYLVERAEARGALGPGGTLVAGILGDGAVALAMLASVRGYQLVLALPDKTSPEKIRILEGHGARVVVCPTDASPSDPSSFHSVARKIAAETAGAVHLDPFDDVENPAAHYATTGPELWEQTGGAIDVVVAGLGTGGTLTGAGRYLKEKKPSIKLVGVDPVGSVYFDYVKAGRVTKPFAYRVEGIGSDFFPKTIDLKQLDEIVRVDDKDCFLTARALTRREGLFVGGSTGGAVAGALKYARCLAETPPTPTEPVRIVVLAGEGGAHYLSTIFHDAWMREHGFLERQGIGVVADLLEGKSGDVITAAPHDRVRDVISRMKQHGISQLPVVSGGKVVGAVAEVDLLRYLVSGEHSLDSAVGPLAESDYATVSPRTSIENLQSLLASTRMAVVTDDAGVVGVVTKIDLIDYLAARAHG